MLILCFERMFARLPTGRISLEAVIQLWLTLNEDSSNTEVGATSGPTNTGSSSSSLFDPTRQPIITLSENSIASLMEVSIGRDHFICSKLKSEIYKNYPDY